MGSLGDFDYFYGGNRNVQLKSKDHVAFDHLSKMIPGFLEIITLGEET